MDVDAPVAFGAELRLVSFRQREVDRPRLIQVDGIYCEAPLEGHLTVMQNYDVPGVIGHVGSVLGAAGINIANFSLGVLATTGPLDVGSACGNPANTPCDFMAYNFEKVAQAGMVVVTAVGNDGYSGQQYPTFGLISSPSNAPSVIAVGGTLNDHVFEPSVSVPGGPSTLQNMAAQTSDAYSTLTGATTAPLIDVSTLGNDGLAAEHDDGASVVGHDPGHCRDQLAVE